MNIVFTEDIIQNVMCSTRHMGWILVD